LLSHRREQLFSVRQIGRGAVRLLEVRPQMNDPDRAIRLVLAATAVTCLGLGPCGSGDGPAPVPDAGAPLADLASCADGWQTVLPGQEFDVPRDGLRWHQGRIYFASAAGISTIPDSGGSLTSLTEESAWSLWIEGDRALFTSAVRGSGKLLSVPLAGGPTSVVVDAQAGLGTSDHSFNQALDDSSFYWDLQRGNQTDLFRVSRSGGAAQKLATAPVSILDRLIPTPAGLLATTAGNDAYLVPTDGGQARLLPREGALLGASAESVLWRRSRPAVAGYDILRTRIGAEALEPFWPARPDAFFPANAWPDGNGGWIVEGLEKFSDGERHTSIWLVDADQTGVRAACDPAAGEATGYVDDHPGIAPDTVYLVSTNLRAMPRPVWSIVKVRRR
jgi:hypothetical protein